MYITWPSRGTAPHLILFQISPVWHLHCQSCSHWGVSSQALYSWLPCLPYQCVTEGWVYLADTVTSAALTMHPCPPHLKQPHLEAHSLLHHMQQRDIWTHLISTCVQALCGWPVPNTIITTTTTHTTFPNMTWHKIPTLAKVGLVSWIQFKAECTDLHDQLAVEIQADFPAYIILDFPDLNPANSHHTILATWDEYVTHLQGVTDYLSPHSEGSVNLWTELCHLCPQLGRRRQWGPQQQWWHWWRQNPWPTCPAHTCPCSATKSTSSCPCSTTEPAGIHPTSISPSTTESSLAPPAHPAGPTGTLIPAIHAIHTGPTAACSSCSSAHSSPCSCHTSHSPCSHCHLL